MKKVGKPWLTPFSIRCLGSNPQSLTNESSALNIKRLFPHLSWTLQLEKKWHIDAHGLKIQGTGQLIFLPKPWGARGGVVVKAFQTKLPEGYPIFLFNCIFIYKSFGICTVGFYVYPRSRLTPHLLLWNGSTIKN
jgi:hypothetical protein